MLIIRVDGVGVGLLGDRLAVGRETVTRSEFNEIVFRLNAFDLWINKLGVIVRVGGRPASSAVGVVWLKTIGPPGRLAPWPSLLA